MKIIQTLWTKPGLNAGWIDRHYHFISWALSCLQLRKYYNEVELYTDSLGKKLLVDTFKLPYTKVHVVLDDFNFPNYLWAAPKIYSYGLQDEPFLHIDGDIFLFHPFQEEKINKPLVYQNMERERFKNSFYTKIFKNIFSLVPDKNQLPDWIRSAELNHVEALNAGVFGGTDINFFKTHSKRAFDFLDNYADLIAKMDNPSFANHIAEQVLSRYLIDEMNIEHKGLFTANDFLSPDTMGLIYYSQELDEYPYETAKDQTPFQYLGINYFGISPFGRKYVHLIGEAKRGLNTCKLAARRLQADYPDYYERILTYFADQATEEREQVSILAQSVSESSDVAEQVMLQPKKESLRAKALKLKPSKVYARTIFLYNKLNERSLNTSINLDEFRNSFTSEIKEMIDEKGRQRLEDVFQYENMRFEYALTLSDYEQYHQNEKKSADSIDIIYDLEQTDLDNKVLVINPMIRIVISKWNWSDKNSYSNAYPAPTELTKTVLKVDSITNSILEIDLTVPNQLITQVFHSPKTLGEGFEYFKDHFFIEEVELLKKDFLRCIIYLISNGIVFIKK
jgi:hypothetical protein